MTGPTGEAVNYETTVEELKKLAAAQRLSRRAEAVRCSPQEEDRARSPRRS